MKIIKKSQIAVLSIILMAGVAGYINYKYNPEREKNLGQTMYVNGKDSFTYDKINIYSGDKSEKEGAESSISTTSEAKQEDNILAVFKYDRDNMYSELSENYNDVIKNEKSSDEKIKEYQQKLSDLIKQKNLITMVENVIKAKGIKDIVIIPTNNDNINVVIKTDEDLTDQQIAQIQQILVDQLGASANKISIECKKWLKLFKVLSHFYNMLD